MNNEFKRRFTGIAVTMVLLLVGGTLFYRHWKEGYVRKEAEKVTQTVKAALGDISYSDVILENGRDISYGRYLFTFTVKDFDHPRTGHIPEAIIYAEVTEVTGSHYEFEDFSIVWPEDKKIRGWYMGE